MKLKKILCIILAYAVTCSCAFATKLPDNIIEFLKKEAPDTGVRFDGLITFPDKTIYLPVIPAQYNKEGKGTVAVTYPANKKFSQKPDVVVFDTNYALLKVIKTKDGKPTFTDSKNIPLGVKTGLLPQDLLVPPGMIIPEDLKILLGDLKIPTFGSYVNTFFEQEPKKAPVKAAVKIIPVDALKDKTLLVTTLDSSAINVIPSDSAYPSYTLKLGTLPKFIQPVENDKYLLIASNGKSFIDVADLKLAVLAKKIDLAFHPSEILVNNNTAYVSVSDDQSVFVIDLKSMAVVEKVKVKGFPKNLALDESGTLIAYVDRNTGDVFTLDVSNKGYENKFVINCPNASKLLPKDNLVYILSRTANKVIVADRSISEIIYEQEVGAKPVDMIDYKKRLYVLSGSNELNIFNMDDYQIVKTDKFDTKGFSKEIIRVGSSNYAMITNASDKKYFVYDLDKHEIIQTVPSFSPMQSLKLINKRL